MTVTFQICVDIWENSILEVCNLNNCLTVFSSGIKRRDHLLEFMRGEYFRHAPLNMIKGIPINHGFFLWGSDT